MVNSINGEKIHYMIIANDSYLTTSPPAPPPGLIIIIKEFVIKKNNIISLKKSTISLIKSDSVTVS